MPLMKRSMIMIVAFLCRLLVFVTLSVLSTMANRGHSMTMYSRVKISTIQVFIFAAAATTFVTCRWILGAMHNVKVYKTLEEKALEVKVDGTCIEEQTTPVSGNENRDSENYPHLDTQSQTTHVSATITFHGERELRSHIFWMYYLGMIVYCTIFCLDFTLLSVSFFFSVGMGSGWIMFPVRRFSQQMSSTCLKMLYVLFLGLLTGTYLNFHHEILEPNTRMWHRESLTAVLLPLVAGASWMRIPHEGLVNSLKASFVTCVLLCLPIVLTTSMEQMQQELSTTPMSVVMYLLLLEPMLKFMAMYSIALSLQTERRLEILVVLMVVVNLDDVLFKEMVPWMHGFTIFNMTALVLLHASCLFAVNSVLNMP